MYPVKAALAAAALALLVASPSVAEDKHQPEATPKSQPESTPPKAEPQRPMRRGMMMRGDQCEPGMGMMCMMGRHMGMRAQMMAQQTERHLAALKADLKITDAQTKAWGDYAAAVTGAAKAMSEQRQAVMDKAGTATLPQRLDLHEAMLVSHLEHLRTTKAAASALYAVLGDDQKKIADKAAMGMMMRGPMRGAHR
jgi:hypothetical protein